MMMSTEAMKSLLKERGKLVESYLATCLDGQEMPPRLRESMLYSLQAGGKRLRPVLCLSCAALCGLKPEDVLPFALRYLRIYLLGMPVILLYNFEAAIFRSIGDTKVPLIALACSGVLNVILNLFFVAVIGMTVNGVAIATVISNALSSLILFIRLIRTDKYIKLEPRSLRSCEARTVHTEHWRMHRKCRPIPTLRLSRRPWFPILSMTQYRLKNRCCRADCRHLRYHPFAALHHQSTKCRAYLSM